MRLTRLLDTSTFRLALIYLALFGVSSLVLLGYLYIATTTFLERQVAATIAAETEGLVEQYRSQGLSRLHQVIERRSAANPNRASVYLLTDPLGRHLAGNLDRWPSTPPEGEGWITFKVEVQPEEGRVERRHVRARTFLLQGGYRLLVGREIEDRMTVQAMIRTTLSWGLALTLLLGLGGGFLMSRGLLSRVDAINRTTRRIMAGELDQRIERRGSRDEFDQLAENLNAMLDQIERLLKGMREVSDNIAHDLRTPLNRLRSRIEVALLGDLEGDAARGLLEQTLADAEGLIATFNALLAIARAEAGSERAPFEPVELTELLADVEDLYRPLAEDKGVALTRAAEAGCHVVGHRELLAQALANLVDNAIKYTPAGGHVALGCRRAGDQVLVSIADDGPGVPDAERERVIERFVRLEAHRATPGSGLGLSLVRAVARLHGA
ncbi:MAG TPA: ATP-binding protein, partial [Geminicoccaceae bacterium]